MQQSATFGRRLAPLAAPSTRQAPVAKPPVEAHATKPIRLPVAAMGLTLFLILVFCLEQRWSLENPSGVRLDARSLRALGAASARLVLREGQVWRIFTAPVLHIGIAHLIGNVIVLLLAGWYLERLLGRRWFLAIFALNALGGSLGSVLLNDGPVSVGASGGLMGLLTAAFVCSFHTAAFEHRTRIRVHALRLLVPALLPTSQGIDYSCHFAGALTGLALGFGLQVLWPEDAERPPHADLAGACAAALGALCLGAFAFVAGRYPDYVRRDASLISDTVLAAVKPADAAARAATFISQYPRDPRAYLLEAVAVSKSDPDGAERALRSALAQEDALDNDLPPAFRPALQMTLADPLASEGRAGEARALAAPICAQPPSGVSGQRLLANLRKHRLCGGA